MTPFSWHKTEPHNWSNNLQKSMTMEMPPENVQPTKPIESGMGLNAF